MLVLHHLAASNPTMICILGQPFAGRDWWHRSHSRAVQVAQRLHPSRAAISPNQMRLRWIALHPRGRTVPYRGPSEQCYVARHTRH